MHVLITGSTGMVGKSVLIECLEHENVKKITVINRSSLGLKDSKINEIIHKDFLNLRSIKPKIESYDACFHCMGVSSIGMKENRYTKLTLDITKKLVDLMFEKNPNMIFNYVSGTATDSSEKGKIMWARVKGMAENYIFKKGFKDAYAFRPGGIIPEKGVKSKTTWINFLLIILQPFFPLFSISFVRSSDFGLAMINSVIFPQKLKILENRDIKNLSKKS
jgi:nucleoside-diphosphate-sugar epimerase